MSGVHILIDTAPYSIFLAFTEEGWGQRLSDLMLNPNRLSACYVISPTPETWRTISDAVSGTPVDLLDIINIRDDQTLASICRSLISPKMRAIKVSLLVTEGLDAQPICDLVASPTTNVREIHGTAPNLRRIYEAASRFTKLDNVSFHRLSLAYFPRRASKETFRTIKKAAVTRKAFMPLLYQASGDLKPLPTCLLRLLWKFLF